MFTAATAFFRFLRRLGIAACLPLAVAAQAGAQVSASQEFVCLSGDGGVLPLSSSTIGDLEEDWREISALAAAEVEACWVWTELCPPARRSFGSDLAPECSAGATGVANGTSAELVVRIPVPEDEDVAADRPTLTAAPPAMWREVPRSLLPTWNVDSRVARLPHGSGPWRVQACSERMCSRWTEVADGTREVSLPLLETRTASHRIVAMDGHPLVSARFHLVRPGQVGLSQAEILGFELSRSDGVATFRLPVDQTLPVVVSSYGHEATAFPRLRDVPPEVPLGPGFALTGRVVSGAGEPVVALVRGHSFIREGFGLTQMQRGWTDPAGRFRLTGFSAGAATLRAVAEGEDEREFARRLELQESTDLGDIVLTAVEVVWIRVVDAVRRSPVSGALIVTADGEMQAGADGLAAVEVRFAKELQVLSPGYGHTVARLPAGVGRSPDEAFPIELEPALSVTGIFVAADGLTTARGGSFSARGGESLSLSGAIGDSGAFTADLPGGGAWELTLTAGNVGSARVEVTGVGGESIDLGVVRARPAAGIFGHVVGETREPLAGVAVSSTLPSESGPLLGPLFGSTLTASSDREGYFELHGLRTGPVAVRFAAEGYAPLRLEFHVEGTAVTGIGTVELSRGKRIAVRSDVLRGRVEMEVGDAVPPERMVAALLGGETEFSEVPEGPLAIVILNGDRQPVCVKEVPEPRSDLTVRCDDQSVRVKGRLTMGGNPVAGALLWRRRGGGSDFPVGIFRSRVDGLERVDRVLGNRIPSLRVSLDEEGVYRLDSVLPGEWDVTWTPTAGGFQEPRVVDVPVGAGAELVRDIAYEGVSVAGIVLNPEGQPVGGATVDVFPNQPPVVSDRRGGFRILGLRPGRYQLRARQGRLRSDLVDVELDRSSDRQAVQLNLGDDPPENRLRIELSDGSDGFCFAEMDNASGGQLVQIRSGTAEVRVAPPVGKLVRAACNAGGRWVLGAWVDLREALEQGLTFDPGESTASLALVGPGPAGGVTISGPGGWNLGQLRMWFGGGPTFAVGETVTNLPAGAYAIEWGDGSRSVLTERRRVTEVEFDN